MPKSPKYVFILGSVISGLGKGIVTSALGKLLQVREQNLVLAKIDPYLNIDAGTMNPIEHGEVFVTDDGGELDVDFGHYERFLGIPMTKRQNITTGQIYYSVIQKERKGEFLGKTVQVVPHITNEIILRLKELEATFSPDVMLIEVGGTIGDIESQPFMEAIRQMKRDLPRENILTILLTYVPFPPHISEHKTKPTQHSVSTLRSLGLSPDVIVCRSEISVDKKTRDKIAFFCDVPDYAVYDLPDLNSVFEVPRFLSDQSLDDFVANRLNLDLPPPHWEEIEDLVSKINATHKKLTIGIPGKYTDLIDSYISVNEALQHAALQYGWEVELKHLATEEFEEDENSVRVLDEVDGILVPGGFGDRGTEGKILAIKYARENGIPLLGICLGFQLAIVEFARHVLNLENANSTEMNENTPHPVIWLQEEQKHISDKGGTMRLGSYPIELIEDTLIHQLYSTSSINERHRHRYEMNSSYFDKFKNSSLKLTGFYNKLVESMEIEGHPYFVGTQFHPEFKSTPWNPSPPYTGLIKAAIKQNEKNREEKYV